jgi:hypothetical protein
MASPFDGNLHRSLQQYEQRRGQHGGEELLSSREVELGWSGVLVARELSKRGSWPFYISPRGARCTASMARRRACGGSVLGEMGGGDTCLRVVPCLGRTLVSVSSVAEREDAMEAGTSARCSTDQLDMASMVACR